MTDFCFSNRSIARAATVAARYSAIRRQFTNPLTSEQNGDANAVPGVETAVLDYPQQQHRICIAIAKAYALHFAGVDMALQVDTLLKYFAEDKKEEAGLLMPEMHSNSSALKAYSSEECFAEMEDMRR